MEPWFKRPLDEDYQEELSGHIERLLDEVMSKDKVDIIHDFALPLQSRALTLLLNVPLKEADTWISWGTHVFRSEDDPLDGGKAAVVDDYIL